MHLPLRHCLAGALIIVLAAGCDSVQPDDGPPADLTGTWTTGTVDVAIDTTITLDADPTYRAVQITADYHFVADLQMTDTGGDVRGSLSDGQYAEVALGYVRHDGVVVRDTYNQNGLGVGSQGFEGVYVAPTLRVTSIAPYAGEFVGLALDFSDGTARMTRRAEAQVQLARLDSRLVTLSRRGVETTFRRAGQD